MARRIVVLGDVFSHYVAVNESQLAVKLAVISDNVKVQGNDWYERELLNPGAMTFAGPVPWWDIEDQ